MHNSYNDVFSLPDIHARGKHVSIYDMCSHTLVIFRTSPAPEEDIKDVSQFSDGIKSQLEG